MTQRSVDDPAWVHVSLISCLFVNFLWLPFPPLSALCYRRYSGWLALQEGHESTCPKVTYCCSCWPGWQCQTHRHATVTGLQVSVVLFEHTYRKKKTQDAKTSARQSRDQHLGKRCHHSISNSDDEQGVFPPLSIIKQARLFSLTQDRCKKTAHAFRHKPARTLINIPHEELNFCITPFWELWHSHDEGLPPTSAPFAYSMWCSSV